MSTLSFIPLQNIPEVTAQSDLPALLAESLREIGGIMPDDILVVTHKVVSKAAGRTRDLQSVQPSARAEAISAVCDKDPRAVQVILDSSENLYACQRGILISERRDGWICCNAGVDCSNSGGKDQVILLPEDCDAQAKTISLALEAYGYHLPVLICDTHGRALRSGAAGVTVGSYGMEPIRSYIGQADRNGRIMLSTREAVADEIVGAATLVMGQGSEGIPAVLVRGFAYTPSEGDSTPLRLPEENRLYGIKEESIVI